MDVSEIRADIAGIKARLARITPSAVDAEDRDRALALCAQAEEALRGGDLGRAARAVWSAGIAADEVRP